MLIGMVNMARTVAILSVVFAVGLSGCGQSIVAQAAPSGERCPGQEGNSAEAATTPAQPGAAGELTKHLTGFDEGEFRRTNEGEDFVYDSPNFGGVWGNGFERGLIVAVVECDLVDIDRVIEIAGDPQSVSIIEVEHSFDELELIESELIAELNERGVEGQIGIDSTSTGRQIVLTVTDFAQVPDDFGDGYPFTVQEGNLFAAIPGQLDG